MRGMLILALSVVLAGGACAQEPDTFGMWVNHDNDYFYNCIYPVQYLPFDLYIVLHNASVASIGGYEVGFNLPNLTIQSLDIHGGTNSGGDTNHLVDYLVPLPVDSEFFVCATIRVIFLTIMDEYYQVYMVAADPPSIPGHDGPVIIDGEDPDNLIPCGVIGDPAPVFWFNFCHPDPVLGHSWTAVKALFD